jgi:nucleoside triphosphate diphosphatase
MTPSRDIARLLEIMAALRDPSGGCPWDLQQSFATIAPYTIEEAYEVAEAIARNDLEDLKEELGDLLLQVVFHARMAEERRAFDFGDVVESIAAKLVRRHPHVFGEARHLSPDQVKGLWEEIKRAEKTERAARRGSASDALSPDGALGGVPAGMPALMRAEKLTRKAAGVGFDWSAAEQVLDKIEEELREVREAIAGGAARHVEDEIGDLLFAVANLARHLRIDAETALRGTNAKFERRFRRMEEKLARASLSPEQVGLDRLEELWSEAKNEERASEQA